jgi:hypothetical protein
LIENLLRKERCHGIALQRFLTAKNAAAAALKQRFGAPWRTQRISFYFALFVIFAVDVSGISKIRVPSRN